MRTIEKTKNDPKPNSIRRKPRAFLSPATNPAEKQIMPAGTKKADLPLTEAKPAF